LSGARRILSRLTGQEAVDAFAGLSRMEGIIPAIESSHAVALLRKDVGGIGPDVSLL
jgi:tryptophan synthase beta subunit